MDQLVNESKISKILGELITKKVIVLIISMLIILPLISDDFYADDNLISYVILTKYMSTYFRLYGDNYFYRFNSSIFLRMIKNSTDPLFPIINITINNIKIFHNESYSNFTFRNYEVKSAISTDGVCQIMYSNLTDSLLTGGLNIGQTLFVCICLTLAAIYFEKDTKDLVLEPLEVMMEIVEKVAKDPINAKNVEDLQTGVKSTMLKMDEKKKGKKNANDDNYEVKVIQSAIIKISALLAIGFGEAGGEIIRENLSNNSDLNPMLKGKKKTAIFGFCDIRSFADVNEALQERTMMFVNEIADIVHSQVDQFGGAANKNIGDAFLMVWKFFHEIKETNALPGVVPIKKDNFYDVDPLSPLVQRTADMSVLGYLSIIIKINKDLKILAYRNDPDISKKLLHYRVNMGFGLHLGWAIEGAIGSSYKIDASYLSPNVNMSARLEAATKQYGVSILLSGSLYDILSDDLKYICRLIDVVLVKGSKEPVRLYTVDVNLNLTPQKDDNSNLQGKEKRKMQEKKKESLKKEGELRGNISRWILGKNSFRELLNTGRNDDFYINWNFAFENYLSGNWQLACETFQECLKLDDDGPGKTLIAYIKSLNYIPPEGWKGVRELTSK